MRKIWAIAWKELYITFTDRNLILIMMATPLAISIIVGLAFSGLGDGDVSIRDIPVAVINFDEGNALGVNFGQIYLSVLVPDASSDTADAQSQGCDLVAAEGEGDEAAANIGIFDLTEAVAFDAETAQSLVDSGDVGAPDAEPGSNVYVEAVGRAAVEQGVYTALVVVPPDFTQKISYTPVVHPQLEQTGVTIYATSGSPISSGIVRSIVEGISNQIMTGNITVAATFAGLEAVGLAAIGPAAATFDFESAFACAFTPAANTIRLDPQVVAGASAGNTTIAILVSIGSAQAMFFALFTAQFGVLGMYDERRNWTLQRLVMSPTPRITILAGKLVGVSVTVLFQITLLLVALTLVGSVIQSGPVLIWGTDLAKIALVLLSTALAVSGFGMFVAGIVKTPEQGQIFGSMAAIAMAVLGGAFGFTMPRVAGVFSIIFWGRDAFETLASGQGSVRLNVLVLAVQGAVMFALGVVMFNRRLDI